LFIIGITRRWRVTVGVSGGKVNNEGAGLRQDPNASAAQS
jgi:hypothetical protein